MRCCVIGWHNGVGVWAESGTETASSPPSGDARGVHEGGLEGVEIPNPSAHGSGVEKVLRHPLAPQHPPHARGVLRAGASGGTTGAAGGQAGGDPLE